MSRQTEKSMLDVALEHARRGLKVFPITPGAKTPPLVKGWQNVASADPEQIKAWWAEHPEANVAVHADGLLILDVDVKHEDGFESLTALEQQIFLESTYETESPSGGRHIYYRLPSGASVKNGVGVMPGLDVRTTNGYVVAAGSRTHAGEYRVIADEPIAEADPELIRRCGAPRAKVEHHGADVPEHVNQTTAAERAKEWLKSREPAVDGCGGDLWTFRTCAALRDLGVARGEMLDVLTEWNSHCMPPWDPEELQTKIDNAFKYSQNKPAGHSLEAIAAEFPKIEETDAQLATAASAPAPNTAARFRRASRLAEMKQVPHLWENAIAENSIFAIGAVPGRAKSYAATGLAYALAADKGAFLGRALPTGFAAVYVDVERLASTLQRVSAWADADGLDPQALPLHMTGDFILSDPTSVQNLIEALRDLEQTGGRKVGLVIVDSLGAALYGAELNASGPATMAGHMLRKIRDALGCTVGVVAHTPKTETETVAGSLHYDAIFDTAAFMRSEDAGATGRLYVKKSNAIALEEPEKSIPWTRETVQRAAGDQQVRVHRLVAGETQHRDQKPPAGRVRPPTMTDRAMTILADMTLGRQPVTREEWLSEVVRYSGAETEKARRADAGRAIQRALNAGRARIEDDGRIQVLS